MKNYIYLVVQGKERKWGGHPRPIESGSVRVTKKKPNIKSDEVCIKISFTIPDALFRKPTLNASIVVPDIDDPVVDANMQEEIAELLRDQMGVQLIVHAPESDHGM